MQGGKRLLSEKFVDGKKVGKCQGEIDAKTRKEIPREYAFRLNKKCFDIRSLEESMRSTKPDANPINPETREELTNSDIYKINKKLFKLELDTYPMRKKYWDRVPFIEHYFQSYFDEWARMNYIPSFFLYQRNTFYKRLLKYNRDNWPFLSKDGDNQNFELPPQVNKNPAFYKAGDVRQYNLFRDRQRSREERRRSRREARDPQNPTP